MKLNHINLVVQDVIGTQTFLEKYFGLQPISKASPHMALLCDDNGMVINVFKGETANYPEAFHIGFMQESQDQVNEMYQRLTNDGFELEPPKTFHGSWTFYLKSPGNFVIEVLCHNKNQVDNSAREILNLAAGNTTA
jgi:lactoylglutathione lyase